MKTEQQIRDRIDKLKKEKEALKAKAVKGFSFPADHYINANQIKVREALIVGLKWVLKNE